MTDIRTIIDKPAVVQNLPRTFQVADSVHALVVSLRPYQWVKNGLVFGGLIFSGSLFQWDILWLSIGAFFVFCLASSGIYLLNDLRDLEEDRKHPDKRLRPLAAGAMSSTTAWTSMVVLLTGAILGAVLLRTTFALILGIYVLLNIVYSLGLKQVVILDVMAIALCFVLRAVAGAVIIGVQPSPWLVLCTFMLALLIGFGKRRHELILLRAEAPKHRQSLEGYSVQFLDLMMVIAATSAVVMYTLYTMAAETVARFGSHALVLTTPWVLYGVFRYLYLVHQRLEGGDPVRLLVTDSAILANLALWIVAVSLVIYGPSGWLPW